MRVELNLGDQVVLIDLETAGVLQINGRMASSLQPCRSQPAVRSCPALFQVTPRCGSRCPSVIQLALVYPGTHPESCGAAPRLQREAIDLTATETTWSRIAWLESECSVHAITIAATAPLGAINELLLREAMVSNL